MTRPKPAPARPPMSEKELAACVEDAARKLGWRFHHDIPTRRDYPHIAGDAGFPDYVLVWGGHLVFAELKGENGKVTDAQKEWLADLEACCVEWYIWRPEDWHSGRVLEVLQRAAST